MKMIEKEKANQIKCKARCKANEIRCSAIIGSLLFEIIAV